MSLSRACEAAEHKDRATCHSHCKWKSKGNDWCASHPGPSQEAFWTRCWDIPGEIWSFMVFLLWTGKLLVHTCKMNNPRIKVGTSELKEVFFLLWVCGRNVAIICGSEHTIRQTINTIYIYISWNLCFYYKTQFYKTLLTMPDSRRYSTYRTILTILTR